MTTTLSDDQRQAFEQTGGKPVDVLDPMTNIQYVLIRADQYERVRSLVEDVQDIDPRETYPAIDAAFREGWSDPSMDAYDSYDAHKQCAFVD
jgi:hypothetical protein